MSTGAIALGLAVVLFDLRVGGVDLAADPVGWVLVVAALSSLRALDGRFGRVRTAALLAAVLSLADLYHPDVETRGGTTSSVPPDGLQGLLVSGYLAATVVVAVLLSLALRDRARDHADDRPAQRFGTFAVLHAVTGVPAVLLDLASRAGDGRLELDGPLTVPVVLSVLAALGVQIWFVVTLAGVSDRPWLRSPAPA